MEGSFEALGSHIGSELYTHNITRTDRSSYINQVLSQATSPASLETAKKYRDMHSLRKWVNGEAREFSYWCSSTTHFAKYSLGFFLHFMMAKQLILVFFFISAVSILQLYLNYTGDYFTVVEA